MEVRLAIRDDEQRPRRVRVDLTRAHQTVRKSAGPTSSSIAMSATSSICTCVPHVGNSVATAAARPRVIPAWEIKPVQTYSPGGSLTLDTRSPMRSADPNQPNARRSEADCGDARGGERVESKRSTHRNEEDDQQRQRARSDGGLQRVSLSDGDVGDDDAGGHRREQRLDALAHADLAEATASRRAAPA